MYRSTMHRRIAPLARHVAVALALSCNATSQPAPPPSPSPSPPSTLRFDIDAIDRHADPCHDFYDYACGGWRASHPIPADRTRWSRYAELEAQNLERERALVEATARAADSPAATRVGAYYAACLDTAAIDARGVAPIHDLLSAIDAIERPSDLADVLAELHQRTTSVLFTLYVSANDRDVRHTIATIDTGDLGLGEPDDYTRADSAALRAKYRAHVERVLQLTGDRDPSADADRVVDLETRLASALPSAADRRNDESQIHPMAIAELASHTAGFDWPRYFTKLGVAKLDRVNVTFIGWLDAFGAAVGNRDLAGVRAYLRFHVARALASVLPHAIGDAFFELESRTLGGAREPPPRWKRCLALVDRDLGDDVGRLFVAKYFPEASRSRAQHMVKAIVGALRSDLATSTWLSQRTRDAALRKLDNMRFTIGYTDRWKNYDAVAARRDDPVGNSERAAEMTMARELAKLAHPTDRDEFFALPQQLDGFGTKSLVSVGFTAGFLQPPVFDDQIDDPINFGGFGGVIGHEITHHFDDEGRKHDVDGNLAPWWSPAEVAAYEARAQCFVDEYAGFKIDDGTPVDGRLTLGENIADNGGLRLAWNALQPATGPRIDGFTPAQRFFLAWGQIRCENTTSEAARSQVHDDPHSPGRWRVNGVVSNMPEFATAFACSATAAMAPATRCRVW